MEHPEGDCNYGTHSEGDFYYGTHSEGDCYYGTHSEGDCYYGTHSEESGIMEPTQGHSEGDCYFTMIIVNIHAKVITEFLINNIRAM